MPESSAGTIKATQEPPIDVEERLAPERLPLGPVKVVHVFWLAGMSCDGCSIAVTGATNPGIEGLLMGVVPAMPKVVLHHPVLSPEAGEAFVQPFKDAVDGTLGEPFVVVFEGSVADERIAKRTGGYFSAMGVEAMEGDEHGSPVPTAEWLRRMAPGAAATMAIGTCATWGGVPSAEGNPTASMSVMDFLGAEYRSALGLPVINVPGCAPVGDNFTETVFAILLFLQGLGPLPSFDELGRPAWLFRETVHQGCTRAGYYEEGTFADHYGDPECLVELGLLGPGRQLQHRQARRPEPHGRLHEGGRRVHRLHDARLSRQVRAVLQDAARARPSRPAPRRWSGS